MKKMLAILAALTLVLSSAPAFADGEANPDAAQAGQNEEIPEVSGGDGQTLTPDAPAILADPEVKEEVVPASATDHTPEKMEEVPAAKQDETPQEEEGQDPGETPQDDEGQNSGATSQESEEQKPDAVPQEGDGNTPVTPDTPVTHAYSQIPFALTHPEEQPKDEMHFSVDFSICMFPAEIGEGDMVELSLEGVESANMSFQIYWERTDLRVNVSREEDRSWLEMGAYGRKLTLKADAETALWAYRAVLIADNNEEAISAPVRVTIH